MPPLKNLAISHLCLNVEMKSIHIWSGEKDGEKDYKTILLFSPSGV